MRNILTFIIAVLTIFSTLGEVPDYQHLFKKIERTRRTYNRYNDSIATSLLDRDTWVHLFLERAAVNSRLYAENGATIKEILAPFNAHEADEQMHLDFFRQLKDMYYNNTGDIFLVERFCESILPFFEENSQRFPYEYALLNFIYGRCRYDIALISYQDDPEIAYNAFLKAVSTGRNLPDSLKEPFIGALSELSTVVWARQYPEALPVLFDSKRELDSYLSDTAVYAHLTPLTATRAKSVVDNFRYNVLRNLHMQNQAGLPEAVGERLMDAYIREQSEEESLSATDFSHLMLFQLSREHISADSAANATLDYYRQHIRTHRGIDSRDLYSLHSALLNATYFNDLASFPDSVKRLNAQFISSEVCRLFRLLKTHQSDNLPTAILRKFLHYKRLTAHLTSEERIDFMRHLMVATQPATYAHSIHVGALAEIIITGVENHRPELLPTTDTVTDWKTFVKEAALYHDLGKCFIFPVITNEYRPLSPREIDVIKTHPRYGLSALAIDSSLSRFRDITLGHHKWYDGKGGYPSNFDNTLSPLRFIIDVITVCDCLEAATDLVGRNYSQTKQFDTLIEEMSLEGGTRYNPEV